MCVPQTLRIRLVEPCATVCYWRDVVNVCCPERESILGYPDPAHISTSYIERQNLTMRMQMRRFTRLTNAFSKRIENHIHSIALYQMHYNFVRMHQTLRVTPTMEASISQHVWSIAEIIELVNASQNHLAA